MFADLADGEAQRLTGTQETFTREQIEQWVATRQQQLDFAKSLRTLRTQWTRELRREFFDWLGQTLSWRGGGTFARFLQRIRDDALGAAPAEERGDSVAMQQAARGLAGSNQSLAKGFDMQARTVQATAAAMRRISGQVAQTAELARKSEAMAGEEDWQGRLLDTPTVAGVESITGQTMTIRVFAQTSPGDKVDVQRALRQRIKSALDEAGVKAPPMGPFGGFGGPGGRA